MGLGNDHSRYVADCCQRDDFERLRLNGGSAVTVAASAVSGLGTLDFSSGKRLGAGGYFDGKLAEIVVANNDLTLSGDAPTVRAWLNNEWGL